jgi:hypothetical protein
MHNEQGFVAQLISLLKKLKYAHEIPYVLTEFPRFLLLITILN